MNTMLNNYNRTESENFEWYDSHMSRGIVDSDFELHTHDFYEVSIIVSGRAKHVIGDYSYPLKRGDVYVIKKEIAHGFYDVENLDVIDLMYFPELFISADMQLFNLPGFRSLFIVEPDIRVHNYYPYVLTLTENDLNYIIATSDFIMKELIEKTPSHIILVKHFILSLFAYLSVKYVSSHEEPQVVQILSRAIQYMHENLALQIKISDIASHLFISTRHLNRLFKKYYNITPSIYLLDLRLKHAFTLLSKNQMMVKEVSALCGFKDPSYFIRMFKEAYGFTPYKLKGRIS